MTILVAPLSLPYIVTRNSCSSEIPSPNPLLPESLNSPPSGGNGEFNNEALHGIDFTPDATLNHKHIFTSDTPLPPKKGMGYPFPSKPQLNGGPVRIGLRGRQSALWNKMRSNTPHEHGTVLVMTPHETNLIVEKVVVMHNGIAKKSIGGSGFVGGGRNRSGSDCVSRFGVSWVLEAFF
ncbi:hypothetical protein N7516_006444 [Penicillium verrucosum]|uniref:uncharacterized protein n=1 Tax=Penicillium verrucosum TaxID=60171 RepID=UPI002545A767|nr:uncharacterized protein N7516_006444 [Penicillium verrucosum]KAJ5931955.1 hypothetical protein N7516_006444 [Penicillium verrucosum]